LPHNLFALIFIDGGSFIRTKDRYLIPCWNGLRRIDRLPIIPLLKEGEIYKELVARGRMFIKYARGHHFLQHPSKGRIMVDCKGYNNTKLKFHVDDDDDDDDDHGKTEVDNVEEEELFMCAHKLPAFSFTLKGWYLVDVEILNGIILK
jgi:hypothetical protein